jgi:hypothetical protein
MLQFAYIKWPLTTMRYLGPPSRIDWSEQHRQASVPASVWILFARHYRRIDYHALACFDSNLQESPRLLFVMACLLADRRLFELP